MISIRNIARDVRFAVDRHRANRTAILMYHSVSERDDYFWSVSPAEFEWQMDYLSRSSHAVISLRELVRRLKAGEPLGKSVVLTFDDGYQDNYSNAFPTLQRYGFPATLFVTTGHIGMPGESGIVHLSADELRAMSASPLIECAPHTHSHQRLTLLSEEEARREVVSSKQELDAVTGRSSSFFAYPYGGVNEEAEQLVSSLGFEAAVGTHKAFAKQGADLFDLPRLSVDRSTTRELFQKRL
jgi:peptidoglycan/xylan/chitin deacetylase (PgdA/CDA1 family)